MTLSNSLLLKCFFQSNHGHGDILAGVGIAQRHSLFVDIATNHRHTYSPVSKDKKLQSASSEVEQKPDSDLMDVKLSEADLQAYYADDYRKQLRQQQCPGCGEEELFLNQKRRTHEKPPAHGF